MELSDYEQRIGKNRNIEVKIICERCGKDAWARWSRVKNGLGKFCSRECSSFWQAEQKGKQYVGKESGKVVMDKTKNAYYVYWFDPDTLKRKTTSYARWWWETHKGNIPDGFRASYKDGNMLNIEPNNIVLISPKEFGQAISVRLMGHVPSVETGRKISKANTGRVMPEDQKLKIGNASRKMWARGVFDNVHKGKSNYKWRGGVEQSYPKEFNNELKLVIKDRDNYICQICHEKLSNNRRAQVHHIDGNRSNNELDNLILLCSSCHHAIHSPSSKDEAIMAFRSKLWK